MENETTGNPLNSNTLDKSELEINNTFYDITGNMNIWRIHETYQGSGNEHIWEEITENDLKSEFLKSERKP